MNLTEKILTIFLVILVFYLLYVLSYLLIPFVLAFLFASLFQPLIVYMRRIKLPKIIILPSVSIISLGVIFSLFLVIQKTAKLFIKKQDVIVPTLGAKLNDALNWANDIAGRYFDARINIDLILSTIDKDFIQSAAGTAFSSAGSFGGSLFMFTLFYVLMLAGMANYRNYIAHVTGGEDTSLARSVDKVRRSIVSYVLVKTALNVSNGIITGAICFAFGLDFAIFWGFLAFILNYIPSIGSTTAIILPVVMGVLQFESVPKMIFLWIAITGYQMLMGNFIEPKIMGDRMRLNTLTVIFGLVFWGYLWGLPGMILSVPLLVIVKLVFEQIPAMSVVSRLMSHAPKIDEKETEEVLNSET